MFSAKKKSFSAVLAYVLIGLSVGSAYGQNVVNRIIEIGDWRYAYVDRLQDRGVLLKLSPTQRPITERDLGQAISEEQESALTGSERQWLALLKKSVGQASDGIAVGAELDAGIRGANSGRVDVLRPTSDKVVPYQFASAKIFTGLGKWTAQGGVRHDRLYDQDPDGIDAATRIMSRSESNYVQYATQYVQARVGRTSVHWSPSASPGLFLSANPRSFDHLNFTLGTDKLKLYSLVGELDSITRDGRFTGAAGADSVDGSVRRYIAVHKFEYRPNESWTIAVLESVLYSGENSGFSLKYLNPIHLHAIEVDNRPKNDENNGQVGFQVWHHKNSFIGFVELMVDDFDFVGSTNEPASIAAHASMKYAVDGMTFSGGLTAVTARAYKGQQKQGSFLYLLRGTATQFSDYVTGEIAATFFADHLVDGLVIEPNLAFLSQGEADIRQAFPQPDDDVGTILTGTVEKTARIGTRVSVSRPNFSASVDAGINRVANYQHVEGRNKTRLSAMASIAFRINRLGTIQD